jgi:hypothetical protein
MSLALPALLLAVCGGIGGYIGYHFRPAATVRCCWKVELTSGGGTGAPVLSDNFAPSTFFRPLAVGALRRAGLVQNQTEDEGSRSIFIFVKAPKPSRPAAIQVGWDSPTFQVSERAAKVLATEVSNVLDARGIAHHEYALTSWAYDDHGGAASTILSGTMAGIFVAVVTIVAGYRARAVMRLSPDRRAVCRG